MDAPQSLEKKFEELIDQYAKLIASAVRRVCYPHKMNLFHDIQQDLYLNLWKHLQTGKKIEKPHSYIYKMALTAALKWVTKKRPDVIGLDEVPHLAVVNDDKQERRIMLEQHIQQLPQEGARAIRAYLSGMNHQEIARLFGWSESVARHRIYRSMEQLRQAAKKTKGNNHG